MFVEKTPSLLENNSISNLAIKTNDLIYEVYKIVGLLRKPMQDNIFEVVEKRYFTTLKLLELIKDDDKIIANLIEAYKDAYQLYFELKKIN